MKKRDPKEEMHAQFQLWEEEFQKMQSELKSAAKAAGLEGSVNKDLESLHSRMHEAWEQLDRHDASGDSWEYFKDSFNDAWRSLRTAVNDIVARRREDPL
jgi:hypothetical protein